MEGGWGESKDGAVVRAVSQHMWVEFAVGSLPCSERFSQGTLVFHSPQKPTSPNANSARNQVDEEPIRGCAISKYLFILIYYSFKIFPNSDWLKAHT